MIFSSERGAGASSFTGSGIVSIAGFGSSSGTTRLLKTANCRSTESAEPSASNSYSPNLILSRSFHKYAHVFLGSGRGLKLGKKAGEVAPGECPLEGLTEDLPMILEV